MDVRQSPPAALAADDDNKSNKKKQAWEAKRAAVYQALLDAIAETNEEIHQLEAAIVARRQAKAAEESEGQG